ncbi:MAG: molybdopterin-guanine dinucleotide biosynthesis protein A [Glaciecola sp.]|jgi:molybdopterin-guanine dinucleotide biosynthesis protein A
MEIMLKIGLVLSGGKSSRMGKDKSALKVGKGTMLEHSIDMLNAVNLDKVVVSGADFDIPDLLPNKGPVGGIYSAVQHLSLSTGDIILVIPNDMPLLRPDLLQRLMQQSVIHQCTFTYKNHPMPLSLFISEGILERLQSLGNSAGMSIRYLIQADKVEELSVESQDVFSNVNTPQELEEAVQNYKKMCP